MSKYEVGFIITRCFVQKSLTLDNGATVIPLSPTRSEGEIHNIKRLFSQAGYYYSRKDMEKALEDLSNTGQSTLIKYPPIEAPSCHKAIQVVETDAVAILGALAVLSANPAIPLCAYARNTSNSSEYGGKFYFPNDRIIRHGTNVHGFLDVVSDLSSIAKQDDKLSLLLRLYRASLREPDVDNQILFQLILLEEASDSSEGDCLAERLRNFCTEHNIIKHLSIIATQLEFELPEEKDVVDVLVKLRNSAAHNGKIDKESLREYSGDWVVPLIEDKAKLHKLIGEVIRYMFCCLVGHSSDERATKVILKAGDVFEVHLD
jgi:hypothetical protein